MADDDLLMDDDMVAEGAEPEGDDEIVARARALGWRPKDEFKGAPGAWLEPAAYIAKAEADNAALKKANRQAQRQMEEMRAQLAEVQRQNADIAAALDDVVQTNRTNARRAYEAGRRDLEAEMRQAVQDADVEKFDRVTAEIRSLDASAPPAPKPKTPPAPAPAPATAATPDPPAIDPRVRRWADDNADWFNGGEPVHQAMRQYATAVHGQLLAQRPELSLDDNLAEVTKAVQARFPDQFDNPARGRAPAVGAPNGRGGAGRQRQKGWDDLPADAKAAYERQARYVNRGLDEKSPKFWSKADFAAEYWVAQ